MSVTEFKAGTNWRDFYIKLYGRIDQNDLAQDIKPVLVLNYLRLVIEELEQS